MFHKIIIQIGFLFEPVYHVLIVPEDDKEIVPKYGIINPKFKTHNYAKGKHKQTRMGRHSTF